MPVVSTAIVEDVSTSDRRSIGRAVVISLASVRTRANTHKYVVTERMSAYGAFALAMISSVCVT